MSPPPDACSTSTSTSSLSREAFKRSHKATLPPKPPPCKKLRIINPPIPKPEPTPQELHEQRCREYRVRKCEMAAEMLFDLWHKDSNSYYFPQLVKDKWHKHITAPLVDTGMLDPVRAQEDMYQHMGI